MAEPQKPKKPKINLGFVNDPARYEDKTFVKELDADSKALPYKKEEQEEEKKTPLTALQKRKSKGFKPMACVTLDPDKYVRKDTLNSKSIKA